MRGGLLISNKFWKGGGWEGGESVGRSLVAELEGENERGGGGE
jgi:hypothetical protein